LRAAALATSLGTSTALVLGALALKRVLGASLPVLTLLRAALCGAGAFALARALPQHKALFAPLLLVVSGLFYIALLVVTRELKRPDLDALLAVLRRRK
jgi:hypothetical protein